jgi:hypothetical protein
VDEDADHDRVAGGADHDGADEGADARLVGADRIVGRLVVGSDHALCCLAAGLRCDLCLVIEIERRRDGDADGVREKRRDRDEEQDVTRTVTLRSDHDSG